MTVVVLGHKLPPEDTTADERSAREVPMPNRIDSNLIDYSSTTKFDRLVAVSTEGGAEIPCDAAWIATRLKPTSDLAASLCDVDDAGFAKVDEHGRISKKGGK